MAQVVLGFMILLAAPAAQWADVKYIEEVVNSGMGSQKLGERKTIRTIYIKDGQQRVDTAVEASKKVAESLERQGQRLNTSKILRLDQMLVYDVDNTKGQYTRDKLPIPLATNAAAKAAAQNAADTILVRVKTMQDTTRFEKLLCKRIAVEMRARYYQPGTKKVRRENRYLYQAWVTEEFKGYDELRRFMTQQTGATSYPSLIGGGLSQLEDLVDDYERLASELEKLEGFTMAAQLDVSFSTTGKKDQKIFSLLRTIKGPSTAPLAKNLFEVKSSLKQIKQF